MRTYRFPATPDAKGGITLPSDVVEALPRDTEVEVLVLIPDDEDEAEEERAWRRLSIESFVAGYAESDAIYDDLQ